MLKREVRRINGVKPEDVEGELWHCDCDTGPGSENRTRFLERLGVWGGVEMP